MSKRSIMRLVVALLLAFILKAFWVPLILAAIMASLVLPFVEKKWHLVKSRSFKSGLITSLVTGVIVLPFMALIIGSLISLRDQLRQSPEWLLSEKSFFAKALERFPSLQESKRLLGLSEAQMQRYFENGTEKLRSTLASWLEQSVIQLPDAMLAFFILILALFWILRDWERIENWSIEHSMLPKEHTAILFSCFRSYSRSVVLSRILCGVAQGSILAIGALIVKSLDPIAIFAATFVTSFLPIVGSALVAIPVLIFLSFTDLRLSLVFLPFVALASVADNIIYAYIVGNSAKLNPFISLLSALGGLELFGFSGLFLGPIIFGLGFRFFELQDQYRAKPSHRDSEPRQIEV